MRHLAWSRVIIIAAAVVWCSPLDARIIRWGFNSVLFSDGGRAFGMFAYDTTSGTVSDWIIYTVGGVAANLPTINYSFVDSVVTQSPAPGVAGPLSFRILVGGLPRDLTLVPRDPLSGEDNTDVTTASIECFNNDCSLGPSSRRVTAGRFIQGDLWTLEDVAFADGGTAIGRFVYAPTSGIVLFWTFIVFGGDTATFPFAQYNPETSFVLAWPTAGTRDPLRFRILLPGKQRDLILQPVDALSDRGFGLGYTRLIAGASEENYNSTPWRDITAGRLTLNSDELQPFRIPTLSTIGIALLVSLAAAVGALLLRR